MSNTIPELVNSVKSELKNMSEIVEEASSEMNRQSKEIERVCDKVENKISYTYDVKNKFDVVSEIKENETSYMIDGSQTLIN
jgi:methyl-accepting chemotaxis protein